MFLTKSQNSNGIISVKDDFATLISVIGVGYIFKFSYNVEVLKALQNKCTIVRICVKRKDEDIRTLVHPKNIVALTNRGLAKGLAKNIAGGLEDLDLAIKIKFDYSPAYINRALVKYMSKDRKGGCKDLKKADGLNNAKAYELIQKYCKEEQQ